MKVAIFGGTFDPIHRGHLLIIKKLFEEFKMDKVLVVPTNIKYYKKNNQMFTFEQRINFCKELLKNANFSEKNVEVIDIEKKIGEDEGYAHTLLRIKEIYPNEELYTVIGSDSYNYINTWRKYELIYQLSKLIVAVRPGNIIDSSIRIEHLVLEMNDDSSSTNIRKKINDLILRS